MNYPRIPRRKEIIDKRRLAKALADESATLQGDDIRSYLLETLKEANVAGCAIIMELSRDPAITGRHLVHAHSYLMDQIIALAWEVITSHLVPVNIPTEGEKLAIIAVGGYGRQEMAPYSDVDLLFLTPYKTTPWAESAVETLLYLLWDLGLKVGHATRSIGEMISMAKEDMTIRTAFLESRLLEGDGPTFAEARGRFDAEIVQKTKAEFIELKLAERESRHARMGDSRFVVEPNIKEGKGGLRDLQTLYWIAKYVYGVEAIKELVAKGVFSDIEYRSFRQAETFLWNVRCHLHYMAGRADERLTFGVQNELAERLNYTDREGQSAVERFMKHYFLMVKRVGDLTHIFTAHLAETHQKKPKLRFPRLRRKPKNLAGFESDGTSISAPHDDFFREDPVRVLEIFALSDKHQQDIHPKTMRQLRRDRKLVTAKVRKDPRANAFFMECLTSKTDPEPVLRRMNEAGVFGRFVLEFGKVVAQMQFDMYHHYTVDEHTIRAISLLSQIERGLLEEDHPASTKLMPTIVMRRALYVAVLLHDIAKGRGGDHSVLGAQDALKLGPRFGLSKAETQTVSWLVRYHLLMSRYAFKRDLSDPKTITDFVALVKSPERLRMLMILTVVDIRAVGPKVWNGWKGQLLRDLFDPAHEMLLAGHASVDRTGRVAAKKEAVRAGLPDWDDDKFATFAENFEDSYWLAEGEDVIIRNARMIARAEASEGVLETDWDEQSFESVMHFSVYAPDHPGIFYRMAGAISLVGASIAEAKIHTTRDGMALDNFLLQTSDGAPFNDPERLKRLRQRLEQALKGKLRLRERLEAPPALSSKVEHFSVEPFVLIDNAASNRFTVIEVNALDRPALLFHVTRVLFHSKVTIHSAHVATYGERAVDVFYITDLLGQKITNTNRIRGLERRILKAVSQVDEAAQAA